MSNRSLDNRLLRLEIQALERMTDAELAAIAGQPPSWMHECTDDELRYMMTTGKVPCRFQHFERMTG